MVKFSFSDHNFEFLLKLADEYQMEKIKDICCSFMSDELSYDNCLQFCKVADCYRLEDVLDDCIYTARHLTLTSIKSSSHYKSLSDSAKVRLITKRCQEVEDFLSQYSSSCKSIVAGSYAIVAKRNFIDSGCDNFKKHRDEICHDIPIASLLHITQSKKFDQSCQCCMRRLENKWPEKDALIRWLKDPLKELCRINTSFDAFNINCQIPRRSRSSSLSSRGNRSRSSTSRSTSCSSRSPSRSRSASPPRRLIYD